MPRFFWVGWYVITSWLIEARTLPLIYVRLQLRTFRAILFSSHQLWMRFTQSSSCYFELPSFLESSAESKLLNTCSLSGSLLTNTDEITGPGIHPLGITFTTLLTSAFPHRIWSTVSCSAVFRSPDYSVS